MDELKRKEAKADSEALKKAAEEDYLQKALR